jgi:hypothetical protein
MNTNDSVNKKSTNYFLIGFGILISILIIITIIWLVITTIKCNDKCNTNGDCSLLTGKCNCKKGYKGDRCKDETKHEIKDEIKDNISKQREMDEQLRKKEEWCDPAGGKYNTTTKKCDCNNKYYGKRCEKKATPEEMRLYNDQLREQLRIMEEWCDPAGGKYNTTTKKCDCNDGYYGIGCTGKCYNGGKYNTTTKKCDCNDGYHGLFCDEKCHNGGKYNTEEGICDCINGYNDEYCLNKYEIT